MKRPNIEDYKPKYTKGVAEIASVAKQYIKSLEEYIDYLESRSKLKNNGALGDVSVSFSEVVKWARQADLWDGHENESLLDDFNEFNDLNKLRFLSD